jgi:Replication initiation factor
MKPSTNHKIDWITLTRPKLRLDDDGSIAAFLMDFDPNPTWESVHPTNGYRYAVRNSTGAVGQTTTTQQGSLLQWSSQALQSVNVRAIGEKAIGEDWRVTRLDLAIDFYNFDTTVEDYRQEFLADQCNTQATTLEERKKGEHGHTIYIGSRHSERFVRIYNKKAEQMERHGVDIPAESWVRVELQLGDAHARSAFGMLKNADLSETIPAIIRGFADFPNIEEYSSSTSYPRSTEGDGRKATNTERWLLEQVAPALAREIRLRPEFYAAWNERLEALINID